MRILDHALVIVRLLEPLNTFADCRDRATGYLSVETIVKALVQVTLNVLLVLHHLNVVIHLFEWRQNDGFTFLVELWTASSTKDLLHVKHAHVFVGTC